VSVTELKRVITMTEPLSPRRRGRRVEMYVSIIYISSRGTGRHKHKKNVGKLERIQNRKRKIILFEDVNCLGVNPL